MAYHKWFHKISFKLALVLASALILGFIAAAALSFFVEYQKESFNLRQIARSTVDGLSLSLVQPVLNQDYREIQILIGLNSINENVTGIILYRPDGQCWLGMKHGPGNHAELLALNNNLFSISNSIFTLSRKINDQGKTLGILDIYFTDSGFKNRLFSNAQIFLFQIAILLPLLIISIYTAASILILKPVIKLSGMVHQFSNKKLNARIPVRSNDEIGQLAENFNTMADIIEEYNSSLEKLVKEKIAENIKAVERLAHAEKMASLGEMVAGVAHEINTPIGIGMTASTFLSDRTHDILAKGAMNDYTKEEINTYLSYAGESSGLIFSNLLRASELIQSFKQIASDQTSEEIRSFNIKNYIQDIFTSLHPTLRKTGHCIELICPDNLDIVSYPGAISQIITNLVMNSLIHGFENIQKGLIILEIIAENDEIILKYSDNGNGIPQENIGKIFSPFFTTRRGKGGTGLGLNIVYNLVTRDLKGNIHCESIPGEKTEFIINIPVNNFNFFKKLKWGF